MCCQSYSITVNVTQFLSRCGFLNIQCSFPCVSRQKKLPDFCVWHRQLLIYLQKWQDKIQGIFFRLWFRFPSSCITRLHIFVLLKNPQEAVGVWLAALAFGRKQSQRPHSLVLTHERGGEVLLWLECTQRNTMDGHSRVNSVPSAPGGQISSWSITCFDTGDGCRASAACSKNTGDGAYGHTALHKLKQKAVTCACVSAL